MRILFVSCLNFLLLVLGIILKKILRKLFEFLLVGGVFIRVIIVFVLRIMIMGRKCFLVKWGVLMERILFVLFLIVWR